MLEDPNGQFLPLLILGGIALGALLFGTMEATAQTIDHGEINDPPALIIETVSGGIIGGTGFSNMKPSTKAAVFGGTSAARSLAHSINQKEPALKAIGKAVASGAVGYAGSRLYSGIRGGTQPSFTGRVWGLFGKAVWRAAWRFAWEHAMQGRNRSPEE